MTHDTWLAIYFTFLVFIHELARNPGIFVPAFIVLSMLSYIGLECIRASRRRRRLADDHDQESPGANSDYR